MSAGDIDVLSGDYGTREIDAEARTAGGDSAILYGEPLKRGGTGGNFAVHMQNGDPEIATDIMLGVANRDSTETAAANGKVDVKLVGAGTVLSGNATVAGSVDSASELLALLLDYVAFDVAATTIYTIDEDEGDDPNVHGLQIIGGDLRAKLFVQVHVNVTSQGSLVGQTMD